MTLLSWLFAFFPALQLAAIAASLAAGSLGWTLLAVYGLPLAAFHALRLVAPVREGVGYLDRAEFVPWWAAHQTQALLNAVPQLEALLRLVPGVYSAWLRLWGSRVGAGVYWTPAVEVLDRDRLELGDRVIVGAKAVFCGHVIKPGKRGLMLYVKTISIGERAFLSASTRFGPGAVVEPGATVPLNTDVNPNGRVPAEEIHVG
ncbi:MAG: acyl transferase [Elusimicrobia bacterium]|nr:acyl transferase [Elusimicrobiota bacterium]